MAPVLLPFSSSKSKYSMGHDFWVAFYLLILRSQIFLTKPRESVESVKPITGTSDDKNTLETC